MTRSRRGGGKEPGRWATKVILSFLGVSVVLAPGACRRTLGVGTTTIPADGGAERGDASPGEVNVDTNQQAPRDATMLPDVAVPDAAGDTPGEIDASAAADRFAMADGPADGAPTPGCAPTGVAGATPVDIETWITSGAVGGAGGAASPVPASSTCSTEGWCVELPQPFGNPFQEAQAIWGPTPESVLVLFPEDIYAWNGATWHIADLPPLPYLAPPQRREFVAMHGSSGQDVWVVGTHTLHYDGCRWSKIETGTTAPLKAVWAIAPNDAWASDSAGDLLHWTGSSWSPVTPSPVPVGMTITGFWGSGATDIWAVGPGALLHWDGAAWRAPTGAFGVAGHTTWGSDARNVWIFGNGIFKWDGTSWTTQIPLAALFNGGALRGWGTGPADVWTVAQNNNGVVWHYNGQTWEPYTVGPSQLYVVWSGRPRDVWTATGGLGFAGNAPVLHGDGLKSRPVRRSLSASHYVDLQRVSATAVWALAPDGLGVFDGARWSPVAGPPGASRLSALRVVGPDVWVAGRTANGSALFHRTGAGWSTLPVAPEGVITQIWVADGDVWVVAPESAFVTTATSTWRQAPRARQLWGTARDNIWSVGPTGIGHFNGGEWRYQELGALSSISGLAANDIYAVGEGGRILHWDGAVWTAMSSGVTVNLSAVVSVAPNDVWAFGAAGGVAVHWNGQSWTPRATGFSAIGDAGSVGQSGGGEAWLVHRGAIYHRRGEP